MQRFKSALQVIQSKAEKHSSVNPRINLLGREMDDFHVKIAVVGAFSAGKSALLNALLGQELLGENQQPETAVANELLYDQETYVEAVTENGVQHCTEAEVSNLNMQRVQYLKWHLNNAALQSIQNYILVDMPGFNSGIQAHNKAILQYADQANAYLLVIDAEDGGIRQNVSRFISEVRNYQNNMAIVITKSELKTKEDLASVKVEVENMAEELFGQRIEVITTSKYDEHASAKLKELIGGFDQADIFRQTFLPQIVEQGERLIDILEVLKSNIKLNTADLEKEIKTREKARQELSEKLRREQGHLSDKLQSNVRSAILEDAEEALHQNISTLVNSLESGGANFSMLVNNILRPVLIASTKSYVENSFDEFVDNLSLPDPDVALDASLNGILERYREIDSQIKALPENVDKWNGAYKAITTALAVTTSVITPWLELILIFLPDIIRMFTPVFKNSQREQIWQKVEQEVIPSIIQKLEPEVGKSLRNLEEEMLEQLEEKIGSLIDLETTALENAKKEMDQQKENYNVTIQSLDADIAEIRKALDAL